MKVLVLAVALLVGCSGPGATPVNAPTVSEPGTIAFHLDVSNQSFEVPTVRLVVAIDGSPVIDGYFHVESQHTWVSHTFFLPPGDHQMTVLAPGRGEQLNESFLLMDELWASLNYWSSAGSEPPFTWQTADGPFSYM
ncbi:MAG: hypothetical protein R3249_09610 [Nitriliruptorales bacterium]|nr:hypothetical protein [Nitriliruptorales bacterium]